MLSQFIGRAGMGVDCREKRRALNLQILREAQNAAKKKENGRRWSSVKVEGPVTMVVGV